MLYRMTLLLLTLSLLFATTQQANAQISAQQKAMARRAAELDAYRKLAEGIMGLPITSNTVVRDFATESDQIASSIDQFIKGARFTDARFYIDDGSWEVDAEITVQQVVTELKRTCQEVYKGGKWRTENFEEITKRSIRDVIQVTGAGAAREESFIPDPQEEAVVTTERERPNILPEIFYKYPARRRLMARRAAELDAYRKLLERVYGLRVNGTSTVNDFLTESDIVRGSFENSIKGARMRLIRYAPDGMIEIEMQLPISQVVKITKRVHDEYYNGEDWKKDQFDDMSKNANRKILTVIGTGALDVTKGKASSKKPIAAARRNLTKSVANAEIISAIPSVSSAPKPEQTAAPRGAKEITDEETGKKIYVIELD